MKYKKNYLKLPLIVFSVTLLFVLRMVSSTVLSLLELQKEYPNNHSIEWNIVFQGRTIFLLSYLFFFLLVYFFLRKRFLPVFMVKLHVWLSFCAIVVVPFLFSLTRVLLLKSKNIESVTIGKFYIHNIGFVLFVIILIFANIFFIIAISKSYRSEINIEQRNESADFLNEFTETNQKL